jgi:hypothetical protein
LVFSIPVWGLLTLVGFGGAILWFSFFICFWIRLNLMPLDHVTWLGESHRHLLNLPPALSL